MRSFRLSLRSAFTLIELLVVIAVIGILIALLLPAVQKVREAANRTKCVNNLKQLGLAMHNYHDVNQLFPPGTYASTYGGPDTWTGDRTSWALFLLPYVEQSNMWNIYQAWHVLQTGTFWWPFQEPNNVHFAIVPVWLCPSDPNSPKTLTFGGGTQAASQGLHGNYAACAGSTVFNTGGPPAVYGGTSLNGMFYSASKTRIADVTDGTTNTLMVGEILVSPDVSGHDTRGRYWSDGTTGGELFSTLNPPNTSVQDRLTYCQPITAAPCTPGSDNMFLSARSQHSGVVNAALADASVRSVSNNVNLSGSWQPLGTRANGEVLGDF
jgi:prepilin-type N-terminal cleavage/methylation domain-containing protein